jgi:hypothetical protein
VNGTKHSASYADLLRGAGIQQQGEQGAIFKGVEGIAVSVFKEDLQLALKELALQGEINDRLFLTVIEDCGPGVSERHELVTSSAEVLAGFVGSFHSDLSLLARRLRFNIQHKEKAA